MMCDLFYSSTSYQLTDNIIFPVIDVIGFNVLLDPIYSLPVHLKSITLSRKIHGTYYTFILADKLDNDCAKFVVSPNLDLSLAHHNIPIVNMSDFYAGTFTVKSTFIEWLYNIACNNVNCLPGALIFNPTYCHTHTDQADYRLIYQGERIDDINMINIVCERDQQNPHLYILSNVEGMVTEQAGDYAHTVKFISDNASLTLSGKNINFLPYESSTGIINFDGKTLHFTDIGK